jgi:RHS repeat-associated protein
MPVRAVIGKGNSQNLQDHSSSISNKNIISVYSITNTALNRQQTFTYTPNGQRQSHTIHNIVTGASKTTGYSYDGLNRLSSMNSWTGDNITYSYNEDSSRNVVNLPNNLTLNHSYDSLGRLTGMVYENSNSQTLASFDYTLDISGNRTSMQDNEGVTDYTYDNLNRLTRVEYPDSTFEQFAFDNGSRRIHHEDETGSTSYLYNLGDRLLATTGQNPASFNYDLNGNLTEKTNEEGTYNYSYSARDRLKGITTPDGSSEEYRYYPLSDLRYSLTKNGNSNDVEKYLYGDPNVIEELRQIEGNGSNEFETVASYIEGLSIDEHLGRVIHDTSGAGNPDTVYAYITDPLGTIRNLVDSTESIVNTYDYKAYGNVRNQTELTPNPYLFTGRRWSDTTKDYYRARNYIPGLGRFGAVDRYAPGQQTYGYAAMNPMLYRDPRGESALTVAVGALVLGGTYLAITGLYEHVENMAAHGIGNQLAADVVGAAYPGRFSFEESYTEDGTQVRQFIDNDTGEAVSRTEGNPIQDKVLLPLHLAGTAASMVGSLNVVGKATSGLSPYLDKGLTAEQTSGTIFQKTIKELGEKTLTTKAFTELGLKGLSAAEKGKIILAKYGISGLAPSITGWIDAGRTTLKMGPTALGGKYFFQAIAAGYSIEAAFDFAAREVGLEGVGHEWTVDFYKWLEEGDECPR